MNWEVYERGEKSGCPFPEARTSGTEQSSAILRLHCGQYFPLLRRKRCTDFCCLQNWHRAHVCESIHSASSVPARFTPRRRQASHASKRFYVQYISRTRKSNPRIHRRSALPIILLAHKERFCLLPQGHDFFNNFFHTHPLASFYKNNIPGTNKRLKHFSGGRRVCK